MAVEEPVQVLHPALLHAERRGVRLDEGNLLGRRFAVDEGRHDERLDEPLAMQWVGERRDDVFRTSGRQPIHIDIPAEGARRGFEEVPLGIGRGVCRGHRCARGALDGARGPLHPPVVIEAPVGLDPIDLDPAAKAYTVAYELGPALRIVIAAGAARDGHFQGTLAGAPGCAEPDGCEVRWPDAKRIALVVHPAAARIAAEAQKGTPIRLTGKFPFIEPERGSVPAGGLEYVALDGAMGVLVCDDDRSEVSGKIAWSAGSDQSLRVDQGIFMTPEGLHLTVVASFAPEGAAASRGPWIAAGAAACVLVAVALVMTIRRRARVAPTSQTPPAISSARQPAPAPRADQVAPLALVLLAARQDAPFSAALARHLRPYQKAVFDPHDAASAPPGSDAIARTREAIEHATTVAVLVSADLFDPDEPWPALLDLAMRLHRERSLRVVPVVVRPYGWEETELGALKSLPAEGTIGAVDNEAVLADVARALAAIA